MFLGVAQQIDSNWIRNNSTMSYHDHVDAKPRFPPTINNGPKIFATETANIRNNFKMPHDKHGIIVGLFDIVFGPDILCVCKFFNAMLKKSSLAHGYLPLDKANILYRLSDGVLLCAMANVLQPGTVDEAAVPRHPPRNAPGPDGKIDINPDHKHTFNLALTSLQTLGLYIPRIDQLMIGDPVPDRLPFPEGMLLQVMRLHALRHMNLKDSKHLAYTFPSWADLEDVGNIMTLSREQMLQRWVNYQLRKAGTDLQLENFTTDLADSLVYGHLLLTVGHKKRLPVSIDSIKKEKDMTKRAAMVLKNARALRIKYIIESTHIEGAWKVRNPSASVASQTVHIMNMHFLAQIFSRYPNITAPSIFKRLDQRIFKSYKGGSSDEMLAMWLNSFGVSPPVLRLDTDLRNGLTLLQVFETMLPQSVNWSNVILKHDTATCTYINLANCVEVMSVADRHGIKSPILAMDIATGEILPTWSLLSQMMRMHRSGYDGRPGSIQDFDLNIDTLLGWFNTTMSECGSKFVLNDFDDPSLKNTSAFGFLAERVLADKCRLFGRPRAPVIGSQAKKAHDDLSSSEVVADSQLDNGNAVVVSWKFGSVYVVPSLQQERYSQDVITMLRQGAVFVFTSSLGPNTEAGVFVELLADLRALCV